MVIEYFLQKNKDLNKTPMRKIKKNPMIFCTINWNDATRYVVVLLTINNLHIFEQIYLNTNDTLLNRSYRRKKYQKLWWSLEITSPINTYDVSFIHFLSNEFIIHSITQDE